jgi:hypothetical protein
MDHVHLAFPLGDQKMQMLAARFVDSKQLTPSA